MNMNEVKVKMEYMESILSICNGRRTMGSTSVGVLRPETGGQAVPDPTAWGAAHADRNAAGSFKDVLMSPHRAPEATAQHKAPPPPPTSTNRYQPGGTYPEQARAPIVCKTVPRRAEEDLNMRTGGLPRPNVRVGRVITCVILHMHARTVSGLSACVPVQMPSENSVKIDSVTRKSLRGERLPRLPRAQCPAFYAGAGRTIRWRRRGSGAWAGCRGQQQLQSYRQQGEK